MASILIVDDRAENREYLVTLLGYHRHRLIEAGDGAQALALARVERPDLVISDILMPTMDGYEFVRRLRMDAALSATPVIFYTAHYHGPEAKKLARDCGVAYTLSKPARPERLLEIVAQALGRVQPEKVETPPDFDREHLQLLTDKLSEQVERLRRLNARFAALNDVNLHLASERDPRRLLESVCHAARELTGAKYALLTVAGKNGGRSELATSGLEAETVTRMGHPSWHEGAIRTALEGGQAMRVRNPGGNASGVGLSLQDLPVFSLLAAPIVSLEHNYGWVALADKLGADEFTADDQVLVAALGAQLGRFYENGSLYAAMRQHADRLRESERRFSDMLGNVKLASVMLDRDARITYCNDFLLGLTGWRREEVVGRGWFDLFIPPGRDDVTRIFAALMADDPSASHHENEVLTRSGDQRLISWSNTVLRGASGEIVGTASIGEDITERALAEEKIKRLNRMHAVLSGINTTIVRVQDRQELFLEACRIAVEAGQFKLAWIATLDREAARLTPVASHGLGVDYLQLMPLGLDEQDASSYGLAGRAIKERKAIVSDDMVSDPRVLLSAEAARRGLHSVAVFPLSAGEEIVGVLALYSGDVGFFDADEMKLLRELAGDISFALDHLAKGERLDYLAYYDTLTGLANPTLFRERLTQLLTIAAAEPSKLAVALLDIDHFRTVNDSLGRQGGDELLKQVAARLGRESGNPGTVARFGPARFAIVFHDIERESEVAHKLEELDRHCLGDAFLIDGNEVKIAGKSGVAVYPSDGVDAETLLQNAEFALRKAKASGEVRVFYTQEMTQIIAERITMENRLRLALEKEEFVLHYQPKVDLTTREIKGVEALLRWQSPDLGLVPPLKFISILEQTGMIVDVGAWVLRRAALDHKDWVRQNLVAPRIAVNVSAIQLRHRDFVDVVKKTLAEGAKEPGIDIEITESVIMDDVAGAIEKLKTIRDLGISIAIDDFGTGYSSLGYLARLPVNSLKIDRSFIMTMADNPDTMTLVSTVISLAHSLRLKVVAEGVETEDQAKVLRLLRCDEMQGYLVGRPVPVKELTTLLTAARA